MLLGKRFRLTRTTTGVHLLKGERRVVSIPSEAIIEVLAGPNEHGSLPDKGLVYVLWEERTVALFAVDVEARGIEVKEPDRERESHTKAHASSGN